MAEQQTDMLCVWNNGCKIEIKRIERNVSTNTVHISSMFHIEKSFGAKVSGSVGEGGWLEEEIKMREHWMLFGQFFENPTCWLPANA